MSTKKFFIDKYKSQIYWTLLIVGLLGLADILVKSINEIGFIGYVVGYPLMWLGLSGDTLYTIVGWIVTIFNLSLVWLLLALYIRAKYILGDKTQDSTQE